MPLLLPAPEKGLILRPVPLHQDTFSTFGTVIENPAPSVIPSANLNRLPPRAQQANQGSALKYSDVSPMTNLYSSVPSNTPSKALMSMFVCGPRALQPGQDSSIEGSFPVVILERHPYTTQTFIPMGLTPSEASESRYLVVVAPSLPPSSTDEHLPVPTADGLPGRGLPDLANIRAFVAKGSQAVTYGAGTWHAPMVVVGKKAVDFVVVQFANGVGIEDCQEVEWKSEDGNEVVVAVPRAGRSHKHGLWKL